MHLAPRANVSGGFDHARAVTRERQLYAAGEQAADFSVLVRQLAADFFEMFRVAGAGVRDAPA